MTISSRLSCAILLLAFFPLLAIAQVHVWQGTLTLPVYEEGLPDPNPPFDQFATNRFNYPYTLRTHLTDRRTSHALRAVFLENQYLKCTILPDLGGHLYTCIDKINGRPMFYANPSIKKANIGYRGAWAAFGVEYNFPVSHNWMSLSPVDFAFAENADGSGSVMVGNIDRVYGMQWSVEMRLKPKSTVVEQRVTLYNRDDVRHRFYWWNNAGVEVWDDSHIEYPMRFAASHGFTEVEPWPVDTSGRDLSIIHNQTEGPVSLFVHGSREPFMGVWNPHTHSGTVHFADYDKLPAKKAWSWGADADGLDWRKALSDNNSAYVEVQAGLFRNQETYAFLEPRESIHFSEYWMPVRDIGGITRANLCGVLHLSRENTTLVIGFNANRPVSGAVITVADDQGRVFNESADLTPDEAWSGKVKLPDVNLKYTIEIRDHAGRLLMRQKEDGYDWTPGSEVRVGPQPRYRLPASDQRSEDEWLQVGEQQELNGKLLLALDTYQQLLQKFPTSYSGRKAAGRLSVALLHYEEAIKLLEAVHNRNTTDLEASYYLGIAYEGSGIADKARESFEAAYRSPEWRASAALRLGELCARGKQLNDAESYFSEALRAAPDDLRAGEELSALERANGQEAQARTRAEDWLERFPESYFLREELGTRDTQHLADDDSRILNIAAEYMRLGLYQRALDVLSHSYPDPLPDQSEPGRPAPSQNPMLAYYRGYCRQKLGQSPTGDYGTGASLPTQYIFPGRAEDLIVLETAVEAAPGDANAHYLLGTLYFSRAFTDEALREWRRASELNPRIPVLDASLGLALLQVKKDPQSALTAFRNGIDNDRGNEAVYLGADQALSILGHPSSERSEVLEHYPDRVNMPPDLVFELALNLAESGEFERAAALFHNRFFARQEGGTNARQVWVEVELQRALSLARHHDCQEAISSSTQLGSPVEGVSFTHDGLEPFVNSARTEYLLGKMEAACGKGEESRIRFQAAAAKSGAGEIFWAWLAAQELPGFHASEWTVRLQSASEQATTMVETSSFAGFWAYTAGMLNRGLGNESQAQAEFRRALLLPDGMLSYHLTRAALAKQ
jgi:tetratricopeptide (TPR) repeat protein